MAIDTIHKTKEVPSSIIDKVKKLAETAKEKIKKHPVDGEETIDNIIKQ